MEFDLRIAKRVHVASRIAWRPITPAAGQRRAPLPESRPKPYLVRVLCGGAMHRLRLVNHGAAVLLDHPRLDLKAERALIALGGRRPDCYLMLDAIAGRTLARRIRGRRRVYPVALLAQYRRRYRHRPPVHTPGVVERYAAFVQARAAQWLDRLLPAGTGYDVRIIPPPGLTVSRPSTLWSLHPRSRIQSSSSGWVRVPGTYSSVIGSFVTVHIPIDWCFMVETPYLSESSTDFVVDVRTDRRGTLLLRLERIPVAGRPNRTDSWKAIVESFSGDAPAYPRRWQRAWRPPRITVPRLT